MEQLPMEPLDPEFTRRYYVYVDLGFNELNALLLASHPRVREWRVRWLIGKGCPLELVFGLLT